MTSATTAAASTVGVANVEYAKFRFESARLNSYIGWPCSYVEPKTLAAAGFYYTGKKDMVMCFDCRVNLSQWKEGDDPWANHQRFTFNCRFLRGEPCGNVPLGTSPDASSPPKPRGRDYCGIYDVSLYRLSDIANEPVGGYINSNERSYNECGVYKTNRYRPEDIANKLTPVIFDDWDTPIMITYEDVQNAKYLRYANIEARIATFDTWPPTKIQTKEQLADAGFYYTEANNLTVCYYCGGGLDGWEPEDVPLLEHLRWFPKCKFAQKQHEAANTTSRL